MGLYYKVLPSFTLPSSHCSHLQCHCLHKGWQFSIIYTAVAHIATRRLSLFQAIIAPLFVSNSTLPIHAAKKWVANIWETNINIRKILQCHHIKKYNLTNMSSFPFQIQLKKLICASLMDCNASLEPNAVLKLLKLHRLPRCRVHSISILNLQIYNQIHNLMPFLLLFVHQNFAWSE